MHRMGVKRIVLSGAPGAGKTTVARHLAARWPERLVLVPEAATQLYQAMRTRWDQLDVPGRREVQQKIYRLQVEQETRLAEEHPGKVLVLDRGTVDGAAYWPEGPADYWRVLGTTLDREVLRYDVVVWLETCAALGLYDGDASNPCRFEDAAAAVENSKRLLELWKNHPLLYFIPASAQLDDKLASAEAAVAGYLSGQPGAGCS
jgi:predicted ATPase